MRNAHAFLTPTELQAVINGSASGVTRTGITQIVARHTDRHGRDARLYWMVIAERTDQASTDEDELWLYASRASCKLFAQGSAMSRWAHQVLPFPNRFRERKPCVFASSNSHQVDHHHASVVPMTWECRSDSFAVKGHSFDDQPGQSGFDCLAIGHVDRKSDSPDLVKSQERTPWNVFLSTDGDEGTSYEMVVSGSIGLNEFSPERGTLLMHAADERFEKMNTSLARGLIALGSDVNQSHPLTKLTPLHVAAFRGRLWMTWLLIDHGADLNVQTAVGTISTFPTTDFWKTRRQKNRPHQAETPLHLAMLHRRWEVARLLAAAGANVNAEDANGDTPLDYVPEWETFPDTPLQWQVVNREVKLSKELFLQLLESFKTS